MSFFDLAGHWLTYLLVILGILYVAAFAVLTMRRAWKRALAKGYTKEQLMAVVKGTASYTIIPAISVLAGLFTIVTLLGLPLSWWRLSVIGSTVYEIMATEMSLAATQVDIINATGREFVLVMYVLAIGIMGGMITSPIISKRIQGGTLKLRQKDRSWGALGNSVFMLVIITVFAVPIVVSGGVRTLTMITAMAITLLLVFIVKKTNWKWLKEFVPVISLIAAMASSIFWTNLLGGGVNG